MNSKYPGRASRRPSRPFGLLALALGAASCGDSGSGAAPSGTAACAAPAMSSSSFYDGVSFLFQGDCATQQDVASGAFVRQSIAVLRGRTIDETGAPLAAVAISAPGESGWGTTTSAADGSYSFVVRGGSKAVLRFESKGRIAAQRSVPVGWNRVAALEDVALIRPSAKVSTVDLSGSAAWQTATGDTVADASGSRTLHVLFPPGVHATKVAVDGSESALTSGALRLTELTAGERGQKAMPATLPATSAYTYASAFAFDEAQGEKQVKFDQPVYAYVDNFLQMHVGASVPIGSYDAAQDSWDGSPSGVVVAVVDAGGKPGLDLDGDGQADTGPALDALGVSADEIAALSGFAKVGSSYWRAPLAHFSIVDFNWGFLLPLGAGAPTGAPKGGAATGTPCPDQGASWFECENQVLHDDIGLSGTGVGLHYSSARVPGRLAEYTLTIPVTGETVPPMVKRAEVDVDVLGQVTHTVYDVVPKDLTNTFTWDGKDAWGRVWHGPTLAHVRVALIYDGVAYGNTSHFAEIPDGTVASPTATRGELALTRSQDLAIGLWDASELGFGGWTLSAHHVYDPETQVLYRGDGATRSAASIPALAESVAGQDASGSSGDGGRAVAATFDTVGGVAVLPDGSVVVSDQANHRLRKIAPNGAISTFAGSGNDGTAGDGGPALSADLSAPQALAVKPDGTVCVADSHGLDTRVRCIDPAGTIRTVLGGGSDEPGPDDDVAGTDFGITPVVTFDFAFAADGSLVFIDGNAFVLGTNGRVTVLAGLGTAAGNGDGGNAKAAKFGFLGGVALGSDGSVLLGDTLDNRVRRIAPDGTISTFAGTGVNGYSGDGGLAAAAAFEQPTRVAVGADGSVYVLEWASRRVRKIAPSGVVSTFAGGGDKGTFPAAARQILLPLGSQMAASPDGSVLFGGDSRVLRFRTPLPSVGPDTMIVPNDDGTELYVFDGSGRHLQTLDALTLAEKLHFTYDTHGYLSQIVDPDENALSIDRDAKGRATAVHGPFGQTTALVYDSAGHLQRTTDALSRSTSVKMDGGALLDELVDANGGVHRMQYGSDGRLTEDASPAGATWSLTRTEDDGAHVTVTTALGRTRTHDVTPVGADEMRSIELEDGTRTAWTTSQDGTTTITTADGTVVADRLDADPRFGMVAAFTGQHTVTLPSGLMSTWSAERTATVADDGVAAAAVETRITDTDGTWASAYDGPSRITTSTTPEGRTTLLGTDAHGRITDVERPGVLPIALTYDARGRLDSATQGERTLGYVYATSGDLSEIHDAEGRILALATDAGGRVTSLVEPDGARTAFGYDGDDQLVGVTPPGKPTHALTYTKDGQLASYTAPGGAVTSYGYDLDHAVTGTTNPDGTQSTVSYDAAGRPVELVYAGGGARLAYSASTGLLAELTGVGGDSLAYTYDGALLTSVQARGDAPGTVSFAYDSKLRVASETIGASEADFSRDSDGLLTDAGQWTARRDKSSGQLVSASVANVNWAYTYDAFGELESSTVVTGVGPLLKLTYGYDKLSRLVSVTEADDGGSPIVSGFGYDVAGRLATVSQDGTPDVSFTYDPNGNRTDHGGVADDQDALKSGAGVRYTFTPNGEVATSADASGTATYSYDGRGALLSATLPAAHTVTYGLDPLGRRVSRSYDGAITQRWVYRNDLQIGAEVDAAGAPVSRFVYGSETQTPLYMERDADVYVFVTDLRGSVRDVVRASDGSVVQALTYDAWGAVTSDSSPGFQPFGFAGGIYDSATGLVHFGAREYDARVGRWTRKDPSGFNGGVNLYAYGLDDPLDWIDLTGQSPLRPPDYRFVDANLEIPFTPLVLHPAATLDQNGHVYLGLGGGLGFGGSSVSAGSGWMLSKGRPDPCDLQKFLSGTSVNISMGLSVGEAAVGGGVSKSWPYGATGLQASGGVGEPGFSLNGIVQFTSERAWTAPRFARW